MFGTVNELGRTKTGGPRLKIDGKWTYPSRTCNVDGIEAGGYVEYETSLGGNQGTLVILNRIRPAPAPAGGTTQAPQSAAVDEASLRFISNVVGSAITAGVIKDPNQVGPWSISALRALKSLEIAQKLKDVLDSSPGLAQSVKAAIEPPEFDDSDQLNEPIPDGFYEGLPPPKSPASRW